MWTEEEGISSANIGQVIEELYDKVEDRRENPVSGSYTNYLFEKGLDKILKKVGEESTEVVIAAKNQSKSEATYEISDLIYHLTVLMVDMNLTYTDIAQELLKRSK
jgi:phosphoribosyl-ATP pyrophosphohydrolase/phosphoribosyl-AMP cyclohydrolase